MRYLFSRSSQRHIDGMLLCVRARHSAWRRGLLSRAKGVAHPYLADTYKLAERSTSNLCGLSICFPTERSQRPISFLSNIRFHYTPAIYPSSRHGVVGVHILVQCIMRHLFRSPQSLRQSRPREAHVYASTWRRRVNDLRTYQRGEDDLCVYFFSQ